MRKTDPKTRTHTLCEPAQSKGTSTCHKSHVIRKITGRMPRPRMSPERGHTFCASVRSRYACQYFTRTTFYGNLQEKCCGADFVRACAVETNVNISQEPLYTEIYRKMPRPKTAAQTLCEPAQSKRMSTFHKSHFIRKIARKRRETRVSTLIKHRPLHLP